MDSFAIKCRTPKGIFTITELESSSPVKALKDSIRNLTELQPEKMKILSGFPPKPIKYGNNSKLHDVGIASGDSLIIQIDETLEAQTVPEKNEPSSSHTPKKRKQEHPVMAKQIKELSNRDEEIGNKSAGTVSGIMMRHDVPSNNSCLFSSIYFIMNDGILDLSESEKLRRVIAEAVLKDQIKYDAAILGRENHDYCEWILNRNNWGGAIELSILSEHYKIEICAIDVMSCKMLRFGENNNYERRGIVLYDGIHYDPLYLQGEEQMETLFYINDNKTLDLALELAREARSSRQFTDVVNFKLKCYVCGQNLIGEKDATAHANATGHVNFGELS